MCGIAGIAGIDGSSPRREDLVAMTDRLRHRGPDGSGSYFDGPVALGHTRLSIIDPATGAQPISNEDGSVWTVFNGEIFNHVELRRRLESRGHRFRTLSDTEVIVHLYEDCGEQFVHELNGQFAIAIWDRRRRTLLLARDRVGIRPLFYARAGGYFLFGSEIKALLAHPELSTRISPSALGQIFTYWTTLAPSTVFDGIFQVPPGHVLRLAGGRVAVRRYWDWNFPEPSDYDERPLTELVDDFRELFRDAVRLQLRADVPVSAYVSGGIDSALVAATAARSGGPLKTFSLRFGDGEFDEGPFQHLVRDLLGAKHTELICEESDIADAFPSAVWHAETPFLRTAPVPLMLLARRVREEGCRVVLTGEGADEVLCGYDLFKEARVRRFCARRPDSLWRYALLSRLYPYLKHSPVAVPMYARRFFAQGGEYIDEPYFGHIPRWLTTRRALQYLHPDILAVIHREPAFSDIAGMMPDCARSWRGLHRDQYGEAHTLLSGYLLSSQGDRMGMAHGVETRVPFLDHRLIEFCNRLPPRYKLMGLREKHLLKEAAKGIVPEKIRVRPKQPYRAPDSASFFPRGVPVDYVADLFSGNSLQASGYVNPKAVSRLFDKCRKRQAIGFSDNMAFVGLLSLLLLDRLFLSDTRSGYQAAASVPDPRTVADVPYGRRHAAS
ncbi:MAG: asparagine synthase (glutamine-hydrolyzing) [Acidiferrobacteraceae bacterium]